MTIVDAFNATEDAMDCLLTDTLECLDSELVFSRDLYPAHEASLLLPGAATKKHCTRRVLIMCLIGLQ